MAKFIILLAAACLALPAADNGDGAKRGHRGDGQLRQKALERFDADKDGRLSDGEKAAAKGACQQKRAELKAKFDTDGDGKLSEAERTAARAALAARLAEKHPKLLAKIDGNGDGVISTEEAHAARAWLRQHRGDRREHAGGK